MNEMSLALKSLAVFRGVLRDSVMIRLAALLDASSMPVGEKVERYAAFAAALLERGGDLSTHVAELAADDENVYVRYIAAGKPVDDELAACVRAELAVLQQISQLRPSDIDTGYTGYLPTWRTSDIDIAAVFAQRMAEVPAKGYGIWAQHRMFKVLDDGHIVPVRIPDPIVLSDLKEYERQRGRVVDNTRALLSGRPAANVLLYGDAGTGKSSTVKAAVNAFHAEGLRLVAMTKKQFLLIPDVIDTLAALPLKFILFIDDLSFAEENDEFYALKSALEGSAAASAPNVVIYATSNRRHLVRETFSGREGDDVHRNETMQELCSLSRRFGLTVGFLRPNKQVYLSIVRALAAENGIDMDPDELAIKAEAFADTGRSPRIAQQFIASLKSVRA